MVFRSEPIRRLKYILDIQIPINNGMSKLKKQQQQTNKHADSVVAHVVFILDDGSVGINVID